MSDEQDDRALREAAEELVRRVRESEGQVWTMREQDEGGFVVEGPYSRLVKRFQRFPEWARVIPVFVLIAAVLILILWLAFPDGTGRGCHESDGSLCD
jgi:hypothetical protein